MSISPDAYPDKVRYRGVVNELGELLGYRESLKKPQAKGSVPGHRR